MDNEIILRMLAEDGQSPVVEGARLTFQQYVKAVLEGVPAEEAFNAVVQRASEALATKTAALNLSEEASISAALEEARLQVILDGEIDQMTRISVALGENAALKEKLSTATLVEAKASADLAAELAADEAGYTRLAAAMLATETAALNLGLALAVEDAEMQAEIGLLVKDAASQGYFTEAQTAAATAAGYDVAVLERLAMAHAADAIATGADAAATGGAAVAADGAALAYGRLHIGAVSTGAALTPLTIALVAASAAFVLISKSAMEWQTQMVLLQNNTAASDETIKAMSQDILTVGAQLGASLDGMAQGARRILDYGFQAADAIKILNETTALAVATGAKEVDVAQAVAQALHQYGEGADSASHFLGVLYEASLRANTTVQQFSDNIKRVTGLGAEIGVPFEQIAAAVATLTREYGDAAQAQTQVVNLMRRIIDPTKEESAAWDELSKKTNDAAISSKNILKLLDTEGLTGVLQHLNDAYKTLGLTQEEQAKATFDLFNGQRGGIGMLILLGKGYKDYQDILKSTTNDTKAQADMQEALDRKLETAQGKWDKLGASIKAATAEGTNFSTAMGNAADGLNAGLQQWGRFFKMLGEPGDSAARNEDLKKLGMSFDELQKYEKAAADQAVYFNSVSTEPTIKAEDRAMQDAITTANKQAEEFKQLAKAEAESNLQTGLLHEAFQKLGDIKDLGGTQAMVREMTNSLDQLQKVLATKGTEAAGAYAQTLLDRFQSLPPETRAALDPILQILQEFVDKTGTSGGDAGNAWGDHFNASLSSWQHDIQDTFDKYATAADMRSLFQKLGIETGDNYAANIHDRVAAWFEPFKAQLLAYLQAVEVTADAAMTRMRESARAIASLAVAMGGVPGVGPMLQAEGHNLAKAAAEYGSDTANSIQSAVAQLNGIKSQVDAQASKAIDDHNAKEAKKGGGTDPAHAAVTEEARRNAVENATDALAATVAEGKLRQERKDLADATQHLTDVTKQENDALEKEQNVLKQGEKDHKEGMKPLEMSIRLASSALDEMKAKHEETQHAMAEGIRQATADMQPFIAKLKEAQDALKGIQDYTKSVDDEFERMAHGPTQAMQALDNEAQLLSDKMRDVDDAERVAMASADAQVERAQAAENAEQSRLDKLTARMTALNELEAKNQRTDKLHDEGNAIENLTARLKDQNLTAQERAGIEAQLAKAKRDYGIDQEKDTLQDRIDKEQILIKQKQDAVKAAEKERAEIQKNFAAQKEVLRAEQENLDKRKEIVATELRNIAELKTEFDYEQHQKELAAQKTVDNAQKDVDARQKVIDSLNIKLATEQHNDSEEERLAGLALGRLNAEKTKRDQNYNDWVAQENDTLTKLQADAKSAEDTAKAAVDSLQKILTTDQESQDDTNFIDKLEKQTRALDLALKTADLPIKIKGVGTETSNLNKAALDAATSTLALANNLKNELTPGIQGMADKADPGLNNVRKTFNKYLGLSQDDGFDASKSIGWFMDHKNPAGLYGRINTSADLALGVDGLQGVFDRRLDAIGVDTYGRAVAIGQGIVDGLKAGLGNGGTVTVTLSVSGSQYAGQSGSNGSYTHNGDVNVHLPAGMTTLPKTPLEWVPHVQHIAAATKMANRFG